MTVQAKSAFGNTSGDQRPAGSPAGPVESLRMSFRFANARTKSSSPRPAQRPLLIDGHDVAVDHAGSGGARRGGRIGERRAGREVPSEFERDERAKLLGKAGFGTVLQPVDRVAERSRVNTGAVNAKRPDARDRLAQIAAGDAEPRAGLAAAGAARRQNDIAE